MTDQTTMATEQRHQRRGLAYERATVLFYGLDNGRRPLPEILRRILRRWPFLVSNPEFIEDLGRRYRKEQLLRTEARAEWLAERFGLKIGLKLAAETH